MSTKLNNKVNDLPTVGSQFSMGLAFAHLPSKMLVCFIKDSFQGCLYSKQLVMRFLLFSILTRMDKIETLRIPWFGYDMEKLHSGFSALETY